MIKKILVISYSQSGQLDEILDKFVLPLSQWDIDRVQYTPKVAFPFPWTDKAFWDAMPESVLEIPVELNPISYKYDKYDLIILGYQPWFLSPSIPTSSLLQDPSFLNLLNGTSVITVIGSRNMWINSQESILKRINDASGKLIGNIPFIDRVQNQISAVTILHWMLTGKKTKKYNLLPRPGVSDEDIDFASVYGDVLAKTLSEGKIDDIQKRFLSLGQISIGTDIYFIESKAKRIFHIWTKAIQRFGSSPRKRNILLNFFKYYLIVALFIIAPIIILLYFLIIVPMQYKVIKKKKEYLCAKFS